MTSLRQPLSRAWRNTLSQLPYLPRGIRLVWTSARGSTVAWAALLLVQGFLPVATVYLTKAAVDSLAALLRAPTAAADPSHAAILVGLLAAIALLGAALRAITTWIRTVQSELVRDRITTMIQTKAAALDLGFYETREYYDRLHRARVDAASRPIALLENLGNVAQNGLTLIAMAGVLLHFGPWLPLALVASSLPALFVVSRSAVRQHRWRLRNTATERRALYYDNVLTSQSTAAELRLFGLAPHFLTQFQQLRERLRNERDQLARDQAVAEIGAGGAALIMMGAAMLWMIWRVAQRQASLGDAALLYQAFNQGQSLVRTFLDGIGQMYSNALFLENLFEFLDLEPTITDPSRPTSPPPALREGLRFDAVTFHYPGSERAALDGFSLSVPAGETVAIVGSNGAGKSTLLKLLCRLYDPTSGRVLLDDIDLREIPVAELRRRITVLFQEPVHYQDTFERNIAFGDLTASPTRAMIDSAARAGAADAIAARLPQGYDSVLGRWFDGAELSVGEWQRIALARAFLRKAEIIVLDEPTSAMDSWAEAEWLGRFRELFSGHAVLIITHRFTTAMQAAVIHVMDQGRIVESGSHADLLAAGGRYAQSWTAQTRAQAGA